MSTRWRCFHLEKMERALTLLKDVAWILRSLPKLGLIANKGKRAYTVFLFKIYLMILSTVSAMPSLWYLFLLQWQCKLHTWRNIYIIRGIFSSQSCAERAQQKEAWVTRWPGTTPGQRERAYALPCFSRLPRIHGFGSAAADMFVRNPAWSHF